MEYQLPKSFWRYKRRIEGKSIEALKRRLIRETHPIKQPFSSIIALMKQPYALTFPKRDTKVLTARFLEKARFQEITIWIQKSNKSNVIHFIQWQAIKPWYKDFKEIVPFTNCTCHMWILNIIFKPKTHLPPHSWLLPPSKPEISNALYSISVRGTPVYPHLKNNNRCSTN